MKYFLIVFFISTLIVFNIPPQKAYANDVIYAKIESQSTYMYNSPTLSDKNRLFLLPQSYFVKLISVANSDFYYCSYKDIKGYVKQDEVVAMKGTPTHPYVDGLFRTFSLEGIGIYSSPQLNINKYLATIPYLTDDLIYYGTLTGQELVPEKSDQWIYCKYNANSGICGYVYSVFCDKVPSIIENNERFEIVTSPFQKVTTPTKLSPVAMTFIIIGVSVPCLIVLILLAKPTILKEKLNTVKPKLRAKRNRDYFEFDDSDLN